MIVFARAAVGCALGLACLLPPAVAEAMPMAPAAMERHSDVIDVQTVCDYRGCFGFGPRQWYRPPTYRPPGYRPPVYYRPRAAGTPRLLYQPPATTSVPSPPPPVRSPTLDSKHVEWCLGRYRSYNPTTNRYRTYRGLSQVCRSPYH
jgi:hypothetical protein